MFHILCVPSVSRPILCMLSFVFQIPCFLLSAVLCFLVCCVSLVRSANPVYAVICVSDSGVSSVPVFPCAISSVGYVVFPCAMVRSAHPAL